jgi:tyrosine-protein phosphatase SIW14
MSVRRLRHMLALVLAGCLAASLTAEPRPRPAEWATPVISTSLGNAFKVSDDLYRCEQPGKDDITDLRSLGVRTILNLRNYHSDPPELGREGIALLVQHMEADEVTVADIVSALRQFRVAQKPVIVHCWHGSDRTGVFVASYRIVFQNWTREAALDEFRHGGFGYHEKWFPNLIRLLGAIDTQELRRRVME